MDKINYEAHENLVGRYFLYEGKYYHVRGIELYDKENIYNTCLVINPYLQISIELIDFLQDDEIFGIKRIAVANETTKENFDDMANRTFKYLEDVFKNRTEKI